MEQILLTLLAAIPFILLLVLIVLFKIPAIKSMPLIYIITLIIAYSIWKVQSAYLFASSLKGFLIAIEIMLIIFGAVFLIEVLKQKKQISVLQSFLSSISPDARVQALLIAFFFGALIEGIAGFGTPAALAAPLLVSIGFSPFLSVVLSLIANSTPVSFGAAGTPILLGLGSLGFDSQTLTEVTKQTSLLHSIASLIIPLILVYLVISHYEKKSKTKSFVSFLPFTIFSWLVFIIPYYLSAKFIGPELPSILAGFIGLIIIGISAHLRFLLPKPLIINKKPKHNYTKKQTLLAILPYIIIITLLTASRTLPQLKSILISPSFQLNRMFVTNISYSFLPFYTPSFYFFLSAFICLLIYKSSASDFKISFSKAFTKIKKPTLALIFALALVQLFINSGVNISNLQSMPILLAQSLSSIFSSLYILIAPFIGLFGSFIAGSNTVSNLLFGTLQSESAKSLALPISLILALQVIGGAIGNMIAIHNVLAAQATVGLKNQEGKIIRKTIGVAIIYALVVGLLALIIL